MKPTTQPKAIDNMGLDVTDTIEGQRLLRGNGNPPYLIVGRNTIWFVDKIKDITQHAT